MFNKNFRHQYNRKIVVSKSSNDTTYQYPLIHVVTFDVNLTARNCVSENLSRVNSVHDHILFSAFNIIGQRYPAQTIIRKN